MATTNAFRRDVLRAGPHEVTLRESGSGPALWYFHDEVSIGPGEMAGALTERFRVIAPVHPGFADAERPTWVQRAEDVAEVYADAVEALTPDEPILLVGSSIGGWFAVELALLLGDRVDAMVLIGPLGLHIAGNAPKDHWFMRDEQRDATLFADPANKPEVPIEEFIANESMAARVGWAPRLASKRLGPRLHRLRAPALVLWGAEDRFVPSLYAERWEELLPDGALQYVEGAGHYPVYERPAETAAAVEEFLSLRTRYAEGARP